jgi:hypothetical protein
MMCNPSEKFDNTTGIPGISIKWCAKCLSYHSAQFVCLGKDYDSIKHEQVMEKLNEVIYLLNKLWRMMENLNELWRK